MREVCMMVKSEVARYSEGEDSESGEEVTCGGNGEGEVRRDEAMHARSTHRRVRNGDRYKIKRM